MTKDKENPTEKRFGEGAWELLDAAVRLASDYASANPKLAVSPDALLRAAMQAYTNEMRRAQLGSLFANEGDDGIATVLTKALLDDEYEPWLDGIRRRLRDHAA